MDTFKIEIPNEQFKTYKFFTFIMLTLNFFGFGYVFLRANEAASIFAIIGLVLNTAPLLYYIIKKKHFKTPVVEISFLASALIWLYFGNYWMGFLLIIFSVIGFFVNKKLLIIFSKVAVTITTFPIQKYYWQEVEQAIWKDDILTIDFKNNKLLQFNINKDFAKKFPVDNFNAFCINNISANRS